MSKYLHTDLQDTIVALSTPAGEGAIGVIRLSGADAISICDRVFEGKTLAKQASHTLHYGLLKDPENGKVIDEVVVGLFVAPRSYTSENVVEISCHGSSYILQTVIELLLRQGARLAKAGEFTLRAFLNGRMDLSQAEAVADLIAAGSASAHQLAMQQMRGGFSNKIAELREQLIQFAALVELELDFGEEDVAFADRTRLTALVNDIQGLLQQLISSFLLGNVLKNGINTVIAGRPNAGKSTLLNALLNEERAIVSDIAGTTRDTIEELLNIKGVNFRLIDTAGIRDAQDQIEAIGVRKTMEKIQQSAILVYLYDVQDTTLAEVKADLGKLAQDDFLEQNTNFPIIVIANKVDAIATADLKHIQLEGQRLFASNFLMVSAVQSYNIDFLKSHLYANVMEQKVSLDSVVVSNIRHYEALQKATASLGEVLEGIELEISGELLALDIRTALHHLGSITGEVTNEDLLGSIFSKFCIGK